ncbi:helix-turn-helix domain-containing protein [Gluconacetobacter sp.]|uniref:helix-turn-helix domain-containing protein n=1 Tax=Gluconacetobacter sp. TaxID=1935994 RepID=UPI0039E99F9B
MTASKNVINDAILPAQIRAGRALIGWTQERLAVACGLPKRTIARIELAEGNPRLTTLTAIRTALETAGVEFIAENGGGAGVRLRKD